MRSFMLYTCKELFNYNEQRIQLPYFAEHLFYSSSIQKFMLLKAM